MISCARMSWFRRVESSCVELSYVHVNGNIIVPGGDNRHRRRVFCEQDLVRKNLTSPNWSTELVVYFLCRVVAIWWVMLIYVMVPLKLVSTSFLKEQSDLNIIIMLCVWYRLCSQGSVYAVWVVSPTHRAITQGVPTVVLCDIISSIYGIAVEIQGLRVVQCLGFFTCHKRLLTAANWPAGWHFMIVRKLLCVSIVCLSVLCVFFFLH